MTTEKDTGEEKSPWKLFDESMKRISLFLGIIGIEFILALIVVRYYSPDVLPMVAIYILAALTCIVLMISWRIKPGS